MKRIIFWLIAVIAVALGIYLWRSSSSLDVTPHASQEIEKAKRR